MSRNALALGGRPLGEGQPCLVVAHVGAAHEGNPDAALRLIEAAFQAGADAIAFSVFRAAELLVRRHPERPELEGAELTSKDWRRVLDVARASGLAVIAEVFDLASRDLALEAGIDAFQTHPTDLDHPELLRLLGASAKPVLVGASDAPETLLREAIESVGTNVALVLGPCATPSPTEELRLGEIPLLRDRHRVPVGLLDPTDGGSAFALVAPALAAALGAAFVEKRLVLDRSRKGRDWAAAVSPDVFYRLVELLRQAERARGDGEDTGAAAASASPPRGRSIVAASLIGRGDVLTAEMLRFKRTDERSPRGLAPREADRVIGRRAARPIQADETIREDMLE
jgi:N,N'-diacetyllegionaminate synthase